MDFSALTKLMDALEPEYGIPGADLWVYANHETVYHYSVGFADAARTRPVSDKDIYILYSATKVFTNTAVTRLIEEGRLALEDEVRRYLPEFDRVVVRQGQEFVRPKRVMTIRDLMTMTAGLSYNMDTIYMAEVLRRRKGMATTRQVMEAIAAEPLLFEPSTHFHYSLCHDVLGAVIEVVTGMTFGEYLRQIIFEPLGMTDTTFDPTPAQQERIAAQYRYQPETKTVEEIPRKNAHRLSPRYESGGAGLYATAPDYLRFAAALANGGTADNGYRLLKRESIDLMRRGDYLCPAAAADFDTWGRHGYTYGLGVRTMVHPEAYGFHTPRGEFGWDGAASSYVAIQPDCGVAIFFGMQVLNCGVTYEKIHPALREAAFQALGY